MNKTTIMVIIDQPKLKAKIRQVLNGLEHAEILYCEPGEAGNNGMTQIAANSSAIVLLDIGFPQLKGLELADKIARAYSTVAVIMLSTNPEEDDDEIFEVIKCGAVAYLGGKQSYSSALIDTIKQVCEGKSPINDAVVNRPDIAHRILKQFRDMVLHDKREHDFIISLTIEEEKTLKLIAQKKVRKQIADILCIPEDTINNLISNILKKMAANTRAYYLFSKMRNDLISVSIAKYGNLFIFNPTPSSCDFQPSPASRRRT